ncbi:MAG: lysophospholipid acyltransferase family protein [Phycisphaeraceae bacterium]|nr:lysophospholipid acyltransferase family protein [Phycisphaeraceae bacterium]
MNASSTQPWESDWNAKDAAIYAALRAGVGLLGACPVSSNMAFMRAFASGFARMPFNRSKLERALDNLRWCFPDWDEQRVYNAGIDAYRHLASLAAEAIATPSRITPEHWAHYIELENVRDALRVLLDRPPCLLITGHCGNWEILGYAMGLLGFRVHALYRPLDLRAADRWAREVRGNRGLFLIDKFGASRELPVVLDRGELIGFVADQNAGGRGVFVPFFDRLASTYKSIALLAQRYHAPIVCGQAIRLGKEGLDPPERIRDQTFRYKIHVSDIILPEHWEGQPDPTFYISARYRAAIEGMIRANPSQHLWMHRHWKARPPHEMSGKPFPARLREKIEALPWMTPERVERLVERSALDASTIANASRTHAPPASGPDEDERDPLSGL